MPEVMNACLWQRSHSVSWGQTSKQTHLAISIA